MRLCDAEVSMLRVTGWNVEDSSGVVLASIVEELRRGP